MPLPSSCIPGCAYPGVPVQLVQVDTVDPLLIFTLLLVGGTITVSACLIGFFMSHRRGS